MLPCDEFDPHAGEYHNQKGMQSFIVGGNYFENEEPSTPDRVAVGSSHAVKPTHWKDIPRDGAVKWDDSLPTVAEE